MGIVSKTSGRGDKGHNTYDNLRIGDLISWLDEIGYGPDGHLMPKRYGIVLGKFIKDIGDRNLLMIRVADSKNNEVKNILAVLSHIESKRTI